VPKANSFDHRLHDIISQHVDQLVATISKAVRENIYMELQDYVAGAPGGRGRLSGFTLRPKAKPRDLSCIAPGCKNVSKGPRFHYLCEKHMDAPKRQYEQWRKTKMQERSQNGSAAS
jgi:hypothetical protein